MGSADRDRELRHATVNEFNGVLNSITAGHASHSASDSDMSWPKLGTKSVWDYYLVEPLDT